MHSAYSILQDARRARASKTKRPRARCLVRRARRDQGQLATVADAARQEHVFCPVCGMQVRLNDDCVSRKHAVGRATIGAHRRRAKDRANCQSLQRRGRTLLQD